MSIIINDTSARAQYTATSGQTVFTVPFEFFANTDLKVFINSVLKTLSTHYTVTGAGVTGGGSITLTSGATAGSIITIIRDVPIERLSDFPTSGPFNIETLNSELDKITAILQQLETKQSRSIRLDDFDLPDTFQVLPTKASRAGKIMAFDTNGNVTVGEEIGNWRDLWTVSTSYQVRDLIKDPVNYNIYRCNTAHTSSGSAPIKTNVDVSKWDILIDVEAASASQGAAASAVAAAASASASAASAQSIFNSINLPTLIAGDALRFIRVKSDLSGYETVSPPQDNSTFYGFKKVSDKLILDKSEIGVAGSFVASDYEENFIGSSGSIFSINASGHLICQLP